MLPLKHWSGEGTLSHGRIPWLSRGRKYIRFFSLIVVFALLSALTFAGISVRTPLAGASGMTLGAAFGGNATEHWAKDLAFNGPTTIQGHAETTTASTQVNGKYLMAYRTYVTGCGPSVSNTTYDAVNIAGVAFATSTDGNSWTNVDQSASCATGGMAMLPSSTFGSNLDALAPSMLYEPGSGTLTVVVVVQGRNGSTPYGLIEMAQTTSISALLAGQPVSWTTKLLLSPASGTFYSRNPSTTSIMKPTRGAYSGQYVIGFSGWNTTHFTVGFAVTTNLTSTPLTVLPTTFTENTGWNTYGPGREDVVDGGDGYFYMVYEGFSSAPNCNSTTNDTGWGVARTLDFNQPWTASSANPVMLDRISYPGLNSMYCGEDMPAFQVLGSTIDIIATNPNVLTAADPNSIGTVRVNRYTLVAGAPGNISKAVSFAVRPDGSGYYILGDDGAVYNYGAAQYYGALNGQSHAQVVAIVSSNSGNGYWIATSDGHVYPYGDAGNYGGSTGQLTHPIVAMLRTGDGNGYWLVASDGGVFNGGDAPYCGALPQVVNRTDVVGAARGPNSTGYWLVTADGTVYTFPGTLNYCSGSTTVDHGSDVNDRTSPIVSMVAPADGSGYSLIEQNGGVHTHAMSYYGSTAGKTPYGITGAGLDGTTGLWLAACDGGLVSLGAASEMGHPHAVAACGSVATPPTPTLSVSPTTLPASGGTATLTASSPGATSYNLTSNPAIPGMITTSSTGQFTVSIPQNLKRSQQTYSFTATATTDGGTSGSSSATVVTEGFYPFDLVALDSNGQYVMTSSGTAFNSPASWSTNPVSGSVATLTGNVEGTGRADLVEWNSSNVSVATSTGQTFNAPNQWSSGAFYGIGQHAANIIGDVNGDGKDDLIAWSDNAVWVEESSGTSFGQPIQVSSGNFYGDKAELFGYSPNAQNQPVPTLFAWSGSSIWAEQWNGTGFGSAQPLFNNAFYGNVANVAGNMTGNGLTDLVAWSQNGVYVLTWTGQVYEASPELWTTATFYGTKANLVGDVSGDGKDDLEAVGDNGTYVATSTGAGLIAPASWSINAFYGTQATLAAPVR